MENFTTLDFDVVLFGGSADFINVDSGLIIFSYSDTSGVIIVDLSGTIAAVEEAANYKFRDIEGVISGAGNEVMTSDAGDDVFLFNDYYDGEQDVITVF